MPKLGSAFSSLSWEAGVALFVISSDLKYLPDFCWCKCCLQVSLAISLLPVLSPQVISTTEFP